MNRVTPDRIVRPEDFRNACARFATGVAIATVADAGGTPHGLTVNSFASVSLEPPLVLICIAKTATAYSVFQRAEGFAINVLRAEQSVLSQRFAAKQEDRFEGLPWRPGLYGAPVLDGVLAVLECAMHSSFEAGDHTVFIGRVEKAGWHDGAPLVYFSSAYRKLS